NVLFDYNEVRGQVTDTLGNPLAGASIRVFFVREGRRTDLNIADVTDRNGQFVIRNIPEDALISVSFIGYLTTEVKASPDLGRIILRLDQEEIDDVIVTGMRNIRREAYTGNAVTVTQEQIEQVNHRNVAEILQVF